MDSWVVEQLMYRKVFRQVTKQVSRLAKGPGLNKGSSKTCGTTENVGVNHVAK
jgi:hypothetical protein